MLVPGYGRLHKNETNIGFRLRSVTQNRYQRRFLVTYGTVSRLPSQVPGYTWLRKLAKNA